MANGTRHFKTIPISIPIILGYIFLGIADILIVLKTMKIIQISIPIILSILCILVYLGLGSALFCQWEGWDISSAMYFCFITLSTVNMMITLVLDIFSFTKVGFGDMVPTKSFLGYEVQTKPTITIIIVSSEGALYVMMTY